MAMLVNVLNFFMGSEGTLKTNKYIPWIMPSKECGNKI